MGLCVKAISLDPPSRRKIYLNLAELNRLRRNFFDRINKINKIFLFSLYLRAGRPVLKILSILSKKGNSYAMNISHLRCGPVGVRFIEPGMTGVINATPTRT